MTQILDLLLTAIIVAVLVVTLLAVVIPKQEKAELAAASIDARLTRIEAILNVED